MADRFFAQIRIGGQISRTARLLPDDPGDDTTILQGLIGALHEDGASQGTRIPCDCSEEDLGNYLSEDGEGGAWLHLKNDQALNGEFSETEEFCKEHGIQFDRNSDHYCEYDAENVYWRPGMKQPLVVSANSRGNEIVEAAEIREALEKIVSYQQTWSHVDGERDEDLLTAAERLLKDVCPELPPELEVLNLAP